MARHEHLIRRALADRYPAEWVVVNCDTKAESVTDGPSTYALRFVRWVACCFVGECGAYGPDRWFDGDTVDQFWQAIDSRLRRGSVVWVCSDRAVQTMTLLGVWRLLETGELIGGNGNESAGYPGAGRNLSTVPEGSGGADKHLPTEDDVRVFGVRGGNAGCVRSSRRRHKKAPPGAHSACVLRDPPTVLALRRPGKPGRLQWVDTANYAVAALQPGSLAQVRCERSARFLRSAIGLIRDEGLGTWCATVGSQSDTSWRRRHLTHLVLADMGAARANLVSEGYYGGRCEAFRIGDVRGPVTHVDIASVYPSLYARHDLPVCPDGPTTTGAPPFATDATAALSCIAEVSLATSEPAYPYRHHELGVTVWPVGKFRTVLPGPELAHAVAAKRVKAWHRWQRYRMAPALASMGQHMLALRQRTRDDKDLCGYVKALANCLVGKLGQRDSGWIDAEFPLVCPEWGSWDVVTAPHNYVRWRSIAGRTQRQVKGGWSYGAVPAMASWITSYARVRLWSLLATVGAREVCYVDTDSLMLSAIGAQRLAESGEDCSGAPGALTVKGVYQSVRVWGLKTYSCDGKLTAGGLSPMRDGEATIGAPAVVRSGVASALRVGTAPCATVHHVPWSPTVAYRHGTVNVDGSVSPYLIDRE